MDADYPAGEDGTAVEAVAAGPCVEQVVVLRFSDGAQRQLVVPEPL